MYPLVDLGFVETLIMHDSAVHDPTQRRNSILPHFFGAFKSVLGMVYVQCIDICTPVQPLVVSAVLV